MLYIHFAMRNENMCRVSICLICESGAVLRRFFNSAKLLISNLGVETKWMRYVGRTKNRVRRASFLCPLRTRRTIVVQ